MSATEIIAWTACALVAALILDWLIRRADRGLQIDTQRVEAAELALKKHREAVESLLLNDMLDNEFRRFLVNFALGVVQREIACTIVDLLIEHSVVEKNADEEAKAFGMRLAELQRRSPEAHALLMHAFRYGLMASVLQWPESTQRLADTIVRLGSQLEDEAAGAAVYVERRAKRIDDAPLVRGLQPAF